MPKTHHKYTDQEHQFLRDNYPNMTGPVLTAAFNEQFGTELGIKAIQATCKRQGIKSGRTGCFEKGHTSWNKGRKGGHLYKPNSGQFQPGHKTPKKPSGSERVDKKGYIWVKTGEWDPNFNRFGRWRLKHQLVWEEHHGKIPEGLVLWFIDGNTQNCAIENLMIITRRLQIRLNKVRYWEQPEEERSTVWKMCELQVAIADAKKRK